MQVHLSTKHDMILNLEILMNVDEWMIDFVHFYFEHPTSKAADKSLKR